MGEKRRGRPTDNPKDIAVKFRTDKGTYEQLKECSIKLEISQAEVLRRGIQKIHDDLPK